MLLCIFMSDKLSMTHASLVPGLCSGLSQNLYDRVKRHTHVQWGVAGNQWT